MLYYLVASVLQALLLARRAADRMVGFPSDDADPSTLPCPGAGPYIK